MILITALSRLILIKWSLSHGLIFLGDVGLILITGETDDMTGDYLALVLNDGYVELR